MSFLWLKFYSLLLKSDVCAETTRHLDLAGFTSQPHAKKREGASVILVEFGLIHCQQGCLNWACLRKGYQILMLLMSRYAWKEINVQNCSDVFCLTFWILCEVASSSEITLWTKKSWLDQINTFNPCSQPWAASHNRNLKLKDANLF